MSKAKELARALQDIIEHQRGDWHELKATAYELIDAVLSEPEQSARIAELEAELQAMKNIPAIKLLEEMKNRNAPELNKQWETLKKDMGENPILLGTSEFEEGEG